MMLDFEVGSCTFLNIAADGPHLITTYLCTCLIKIIVRNAL